MDSATYWKNRETEQRKHNIRDEKEYQKRIREIYQNMIDESEKEIHGFYGKYASKEGITISEARKRAAKLDIEAYARKAKKYVKEKNFSDEANAEMRLYNMTMRANRLELLKANIGLEMIAGFDELQKFFDEKLTDRATGEFERLAGILGETVQDNAKAAHAIVNASFHNATFSDRIWMYQDMLKAELSSLLQTGLIRGQSSTKLAKHLEKRFGVSQSNAERLMTTELRRVQTDAARQVYERNGNTEYKFLTTNPQGACDICKKLDGKVFKVKNMVPGKNAPPMHPWCHCTTAPYWNNDEFDEWLNSGSELNFADWKNQKDNSVAKKSGSGIMNSGATSGALTDKNDPLYVKRDKHAYTYYEAVRNSKKSPIVKRISKNSGFSEEYISKVYDHVFINEYDLYEGKKRFEPDYDMAESFRRLREGKDIQEHDMVLLKHEHLEYGLMNKLGIPYDKAHDLAQSKYDYAAALNDFKKKNNL